MKHVNRTFFRKSDNGDATRAIGQLLHDPNALNRSSTDVVNTIRLFTEGDDDVDILQEALLRVFSNNLKLRAQLLGIARRPHISYSNDDWHHNGVDDSAPVVNAGADIPTALTSSEASVEELHLLLLQKLITNIIAESTAPADTGGTGGTPSLD